MTTEDAEGLMRERDQLAARVKHLEERERDIADLLKVADGGRYRADWKAPIERAVAEAAKSEERLEKLGAVAQAHERDLCAIWTALGYGHEPPESVQAIVDLIASRDKKVASAVLELGAEDFDDAYEALGDSVAEVQRMIEADAEEHRRMTLKIQSLETRLAQATAELKSLREEKGKTP